MKNVSDLSEVDSKAELGYMAVDFLDSESNLVKLKLRREDDGSWFSIYMNNPSTPTNSIYVFGEKVWEEKAGKEVTIPFNVVPMETGTYVVRQAYTGKGNNMHFLDTKEDTLKVKAGEIIYLGTYTGQMKKFLGLFPYSYEVKTQNIENEKIKNTFGNLPVEFNSIYLK